ncbi:spermatogenesis-associated protein 9 isoform X2 [Octodon degus]|uniref:Spermatogenesis-associated protein 9 isoform X2 n=1 Tax=Octodon degus TaxID=10160 RepID=A0A6P6DX05_OCTDE|nr:spermatogenesis-associated protein 9 isoform X2 [Octodon degus]
MWTVEEIQKVIMDLMDEFKDDFPHTLGLSQANQKEEPAQKTSKIRRAASASSPPGPGLLGLALSSLSWGCRALAGLLRPWLVGRLAELRAGSHRCLHQLLGPPKGPSQARKSSLFEIISFPAMTVLTGMMYTSYAALIYLAICANAVLEKARSICEEEEVMRQNRESEHSRKAFSEPVLSEPMFPEGEIKAKPYRSLPEKPGISYHPELPGNKQNNKIQVLHSVFDQSAETNEQT